MSRSRALLAVAACLLTALSVVGPAAAAPAGPVPAEQSTAPSPVPGGGDDSVPVDQPANGDVHVDSMSEAKRVAQESGGKVDVVFVLDDTGSMGGAISGAKENIRGFAQDLEEEGIDAHYGLITFKDDVEVDQKLTGDLGKFQDSLDAVRASGGGDGREDNFDALKRATEMEFRQDAKRVVVDITDAPAHTSVTDDNHYEFRDGEYQQTDVTKYTMEDVVEFMEPYAAYVAVSYELSYYGGCDDPLGPRCGDKRVLAQEHLEDGSWVDLAQINSGDESDFGDILDVIEGIIDDVVRQPGGDGSTAGPPDVEYVDRELSKTTVRPGEPFRVNVTLRNYESDAVGYTAIFRSDLTLLTTKRGEVPGEDAKEFSVRTQLREPGDHRIFVASRYIGTVTVEGEPVEDDEYLEVREAFTTRIALEPGDSYETVSVVHNRDTVEREFALNYSREGVVNTTLDETVTLEAGETRLVRHEREIPSDADSAVGVEQLNGEPVGNLSVSSGDGGGSSGAGLVYTYVVATPDGEDRYKLVMVLRNPGEETATYPLRLVPPDADRRSFDRYMEDVIETERTLAPGETAVVERPITRPTAESPPFGEFNWRVNGVSVPVVVSYGDLRDASGSGSGSGDGSGS